MGRERHRLFLLAFALSAGGHAHNVAVQVGADGDPSVANGQFPAPDLPFPPMPSTSVIGATLKDSVNHWPPKRKPIRKDAPNVLLIMNDDSGYGHSDTFGGPIHTPALSKVYNAGIAYNRFHNTAICSPTRAALLTGRNHHAVGTGQITEGASGFPGYTGKIPKTAATVAKVLSGYGYDTACFGKWHNTPVTDLQETGPFDQYPTGLGFSFFYGFLAGETQQFYPRLYKNTNPIEPPLSPEEGYHLTEDLANQTIKFIRNNRAYTPDRPFFIYYAPGATHAPHQVPFGWADKYKGKFDDGWEVLRTKTFDKQKEMGWIPSDAQLTPIDPTMIKWADIPANQTAFQIRLMEVYAGFLEHTDTQTMKVLNELDAQGLTDNTLIIYVYADNGASAEGIYGTLAELLAENSMPSTVDNQMEVLNSRYGGLDALGTKHLDNMYHASWAWAGDTPFKSTKLVAAHFGGTRTPLVVSWPKVITPDKTPRSQFHHVIDVVPTIYEAIGIKAPGAVEGVTQQKLDGVSMVYSWHNASAPGTRHDQYFEVMGSRGIYKDGWYACTLGPRIPWHPNNTRLEVWDPDTDVWELYHLDSDFTQATDLAQQNPDKLAELKSFFSVQAALNDVLPVGAGLYTVYYHPEEAPASDLTEWNLYEGQVRAAESNAPLYRSGFSSLATAQLEVPADASGVIYCVGGTGGGFTVYMDKGYLYAEYFATLVYNYTIASQAPISPDATKVQVEFMYDERKPRAAATVTLLANDKVVGSGRVGTSVPLAFDASETFDVGMDLGSPVSLVYEDRLPFKFSGKINSLNIKYVNKSLLSLPEEHVI